MPEGKDNSTADPDGEWMMPQEIALHWVDAAGKSLGPSIPGHVKARAAWVGRYGDRWVEIFPGGTEYARPN